MKTLKIVALSAILAAPAAYATDATDPTEEQLDSVRAAIASVGCVVDSEETAVDVESATGFGEDLLKAAVDKLRVYEEIVDASEAGGIKLVTGQCEA